MIIYIYIHIYIYIGCLTDRDIGTADTKGLCLVKVSQSSIILNRPITQYTDDNNDYDSIIPAYTSTLSLDVSFLDEKKEFLTPELKLESFSFLPNENNDEKNTDENYNTNSSASSPYMKKSSIPKSNRVVTILSPNNNDLRYTYVYMYIYMYICTLYIYMYIVYIYVCIYI
jgi:hypothetical protein